MSDDATGSDDGRHRSDRSEPGDVAADVGDDPAVRDEDSTGAGESASTDEPASADELATDGATSSDVTGTGVSTDETGGADADLHAEVERLRESIEAFEAEIEERTVHRETVERDLKRYVRRRARRGRARGWGPYLVLLYGTAMTIGAFSFLDDGLWAILAMLVIWTSTLGVYVLMVVIGAGLSLLDLPGRVRDAVGSWRS